MDKLLKHELSEARRIVRAQLRQMEGSVLDGEDVAPDNRQVYSVLQTQLRELDLLLGSESLEQGQEHGRPSSYAPMVRMHDDGSVGIPYVPTRSAKNLALLCLAMMMIPLALLFF